MIGEAQPGEDGVLTVEQVGERGIDTLSTCGGETNLDTSAITWVRGALDEAVTFKTIEPVRHRAAGDERLTRQSTGGQGIRRTASPQCCEHIELTGLEVESLEGRSPGDVEMAGESTDAGEDLERRDIEIGAFASPGRDDPIDTVTPIDSFTRRSGDLLGHGFRLRCG